MLIYRILSKEKNNLTFLNKTDENIEVIEAQIREFKKHNIKLDDLKKVADDSKNQYLKLKLMDIYTLYNRYEEEISDKYIDEEDTLTKLSEDLDKTDIFKNAVIYIDEFVGFTEQEYDIIRKLLRVAKQVNVTMCTDTLKMFENKEADLFNASKETLQRIIDIAKQEKISIEKDVCLNELKRFKVEELKHLEKNLYKPKYEEYDKEVQNIELFLAKNQFSEVENVAKTIVELVRDNKYRYNEISIITKDIGNYASIVKAVFSKYDIPVYIDDLKLLSQNILVKHILSVIDIFSKNWSYEAVFNYLKTGLVNLNENEIFLLENYCIKYGIYGSKWYKEPWRIASNDEELQSLNILRQKVIEPLLKFKEGLNKRKNAKEISQVIYEFLIQNETDKALEIKINELEKIGELDLASSYKTSWDVLMQLFDEMVLVLNEEQLSFDEYAKILKIGLKNSGLGTLPQTIDQVIIGDVDRSRIHKVKAIFIIGLNDGVFPKINRDEGFLNDKERDYLKQNKIELAKGQVELLFEENFNIYKALLSSEEKLYLSYASSNNLGTALRPSMLIPKIKKIFPKIKEKSDIIENVNKVTTKKATFEELLVEIRKYQDNEEVEEVWFEIYNIYKSMPEYKQKLKSSIQGLKYENKTEKVTKDLIEKLYGKTLKTSISRLEQYKRCAFSYYLKYGLGLSKINKFKMESLDTGSFMHDVIDEFFEQITARQIDLKTITEKKIEEIVTSIINEKLTLNRNYIFSATSKYKLLTNRLKKLILQSMKYIIQTITESEFNIYGNEIEFKEGKEYKPITVTLDDGKKVEITGKIDRIDLAQNEEGKFVRIIDYKSSIKNLDLNEFMAGLQIQLLTYLDAVTKKEEVIPAGVLYFNLIEPIIKADKNMSDEEIEQTIRKQFKMQGLILADVKVAKMMDKNLESGASKIIPAYIDSKNQLSEAKSNIVTKEQFINLQNYTSKVIKQIAEEILSGNIEIKPSYNQKNKKTPCKYCEYKSICNFDSSRNEYNYVPNLDKQVILDIIKNK